jgi:putative two-component system response regulator
MITLTAHSADMLGTTPVVMNPSQITTGRVFAQADFIDFVESLKKTSPEDPMLEKRYMLNIHGSHRWCKIIARSMWANNNGIVYEGAIGKIVDIHEETQIIQELESQAAHDSLTGLLNHRAARGLITKALDAPEEKQYAMVMFDLDDFKKANDDYGHLFGDEVLLHVADVLQDNTRDEDVLCRVGGDEFLVFMEYKTTVKPQVERIFNCLSGVYRDFPLRVSVGVAFAKDCLGDYDILFQMADRAMYAVKFQHKNGICYYDEMERTGSKAASYGGGAIT